METNKNNIRLAAANMLLDRGVRYTISEAPLILRILRLNKLHIRPLKAGAILEIGAIINENKLTDAIGNEAYFHQEIEKVCRIIAIAVLNDKRKIRYFANLLSRLFFWKVPVKVLYMVFYQIVQINNLTDFINITKYFIHQSQMILNPKNLGR